MSAVGCRKSPREQGSHSLPNGFDWPPRYDLHGLRTAADPLRVGRGRRLVSRCPQLAHWCSRASPPLMPSGETSLGSGIESLEVGRIVAERNLAGGARVYCVGDRRRDKCPVGTQHGRQGRIQYVEQAKFTLRSGGAIDMPTAELTPPRCWSPVELRPKSVALRSRRPLGPCNPTGRAPSGFVSRRCSSTRCPRTRRERSMSSPASSARVGRTLQQPAGVHVELIAGARTYGVGCPSTLEYRELSGDPKTRARPKRSPARDRAP